MIIGIGTDIIEIKRVTKAIANQNFIKKCYSDAEKNLCIKNKIQFASNFAVKEAVSKVLGTGFRKFSPKDIEVLRDDYGKPFVILKGNAKVQMDFLKIKKLHVSISHNKTDVIAYVIGEGECN